MMAANEPTRRHSADDPITEVTVDQMPYGIGGKKIVREARVDAARFIEPNVDLAGHQPPQTGLQRLHQVLALIPRPVRIPRSLYLRVLGRQDEVILPVRE